MIFSSLGIQLILKFIWFDKEISKMFSAMWCRSLILLPFSTIIEAAWLSVFQKTVFENRKCENDFRQNSMAVSSLHVELLSFSRSLQFLWAMLVSESLRINPPQATLEASENENTSGFWMTKMDFLFKQSRFLCQNSSSEITSIFKIL